MLVAVSQRVDVVPERGERRDALDQAWTRFLAACGLTPVLIPNDRAAAEALMHAVPVCGVVLTGGNDLTVVGGDTPERDDTEATLLAEARRSRLPVIGVCRGMQMIQHSYGVTLRPVTGHVGTPHPVVVDGQTVSVNSYHAWGAFESVPSLEVCGRAADGVIEAVRDPARRILGIMWHPERLAEPSPGDVDLFHNWLVVNSSSACAR